MSQINFPQNEEEVLQYWKEQNIFKKTLAKDSPKGNFVFFEGPPTANGKPGIHHVLARAFKDVIPRFKTMQGYHVGRKAGWDTHGLPVELQVEKALGISGKPDIESLRATKEESIEFFNSECKKSVWQYKEDWEKLTERIAFWLDLNNAYVTYHNSYIESLWSIMKKVNDKGLLYRGHKVVPHCPRCGTALSSHEVAQGYKEVEENSVFLKFKVVNPTEHGLPANTYILSWTTTPWTLPGNVGLAIKENIEYLILNIAGSDEKLIMASALVDKVFSGQKFEVEKKLEGKDLLGLEYEPLFPESIPEVTVNYKSAYKVYPADFVTTEDGTGVVHTAVMYGEDDYQLGEKVGLPKHHTVDENGNFQFPISNFQILNGLNGKFVKDKKVEKVIVDYLKEQGYLLREQPYKHDYPFCWRCGTPLLYYAKDSWFIKMTAVKNDLLKNAETINWIPEHIKEGRFGEWLHGVKDWAISRERYWGTPLPVWQCQSGKSQIPNSKFQTNSNDQSSKNSDFEGCGNIKVIGSVAELKENIKGDKITKLILVRHGHSDHNVTDVFDGRIDSKCNLTAEGIKEAELAAEKLMQEKDAVIYVSPILRARQTAKIIGDKLNLQQTIANGLTEVDNGNWEGMNRYDRNILENRKKYKSLTFEQQYDARRGDTGESWRMVADRMYATVKDIVEQNRGKTIILVGHQGSMIYLCHALENLSLNQCVELFDEDIWQEYAEPITVYVDSDTKKELDLHRPFIDHFTFDCEKCGKKMSRISEVADCWFDSGSMPFAQWHYPFENKELIDSNTQYPAEFIAEAIDQTRGWFYTLLAVSTLMDKGSSYKNVICLGHINDAQGLKMSKSKGNIVDPWMIINKYGSDALRWHLYTINQPGESKSFDEKNVDEVVKKVFLILWNVYTFYSLYSNNSKKIFNIQYSIFNNVLDKWIISELNELIKDVTRDLESYDIFGAGRRIADFVNELSTWYVRRSRDRFKVDGEDKDQALATLNFVLVNVSKLMAPFAPFFAETLYRNLTDQESVHLESWPEAGEVDQKILNQLYLARQIVELGLFARAESGMKIRQPLQYIRYQYQGKNEKLSDELEQVIADELNVKEVKYTEEVREQDDRIVKENGFVKIGLNTTLTDELKREGLKRELTRQINNLRKEAGLTIQDSITLYYETEDEILAGVLSELRSEVLAKDSKCGRGEVTKEAELNIDGKKVWVGIGK